ncbi:MAG: hypothetical protein JSS66_06420 [Armatimonadetes bacterium]|nr:hypothetical protein [Armatimonadota bacterium]
MKKVNEYYVYVMGHGGYESGCREVLLHKTKFTQEKFSHLVETAMIVAAKKDQRRHKKWTKGMDKTYEWHSHYSYFHRDTVKELVKTHGFIALGNQRQAEWFVFGDSNLLADPDPKAPWNEWTQGNTLHAQKVMREAFPQEAREWDEAVPARYAQVEDTRTPEERETDLKESLAALEVELLKGFEAQENSE